MSVLAMPRQISVRPLILASALTALLMMFPFGEIATYPFLLFATLIHETAHAAVAIFTFGDVDRIQLFWNGSGVTYSSGGIRLFISSAGYVGTALFGAVLLLLSANAKATRITLLALAFLILGITLSFGSGLFTWIAGLLLAFGFFASSRIQSIRARQFLLALTAVQCSLHSLLALKSLWFISFTDSCSDAHTLANMTGIPAVFWALFWMIVSLVPFAIALRHLAKRA